MSTHLILGGAASGKSVFAEQLALATEKPVVYIATAPHLDDVSWQQKIQKHQQRRPKDWQTVEACLTLAETIQDYSHHELLLVDCVSLWLSNVLLAEYDIDDAMDRLCRVIKEINIDILLVSNEVGMGIVPEYALSRDFREAQGALNQQLAQIADQVDMVIAGLPMKLKGSGSYANCC